MENKIEKLKTIIIVLAVIAIVIYNFVIKKNNSEELNYSELLVNENVEKNEIKEETEKIKVYIIGQVNKPGVIELEYGSRIEDAIISAGGTTKESDLSKINLACSLEDGQKIYIPSINDKVPDEDIDLQNDNEIIEQSNSNNSKSKININVADINELVNLPGVGEALAQRIITYREENGKFKKIEDLKNVTGIGEKKYENLKEYICIK